MLCLLLLPLLMTDSADTFATARRLMLEGDLARAVPLLESLLAETESASERSRTGFLLEAIDQSVALASGEPALVDAVSEPELPPGAAEYALSVVPGDAGGWMRGRFGLTLLLPEEMLHPGDSLRIWMPLAEETAIQEPDSPAWEATGIRSVESVIRFGERGALPVLHLAGVAEGGAVTITLEQDFTAFGAAAPVTDPENVVLAVPGTDPETDRALASSGVISTEGDVSILARRIGGSSPDPLERLEAIQAFATDSIGAGPVPWALYAFEGISRAVARTRRADALCLAVFLASVCRVNGIPCRVTGGWSTAPGGPVRHSRAEVLLEEAVWTPLDIPMARAAERDGLDGAPFLEGYSDAARVYTYASLEDSLSPGKYSWVTSPPGAFPEAEIRGAGDRWTAVPLRILRPATTVTLEWRD